MLYTHPCYVYEQIQCIVYMLMCAKYASFFETYTSITSIAMHHCTIGRIYQYTRHKPD